MLDVPGAGPGIPSPAPHRPAAGLQLRVLNTKLQNCPARLHPRQRESLFVFWLIRGPARPCRWTLGMCRHVLRMGLRVLTCVVANAWKHRWSAPRGCPGNLRAAVVRDGGTRSGKSLRRSPGATKEALGLLGRATPDPSACVLLSSLRAAREFSILEYKEKERRGLFLRLLNPWAPRGQVSSVGRSRPLVGTCGTPTRLAGRGKQS